jgi:MFS family permease
MTSLCKEYYQFFLAQGVLGGISMGMVMAPAMASIGQYFHKNRGAAMGLAVGGSSLGGVIFPIVLSKTLNNPKISFGWSVRIAGFIMLPLILIGCATIRARLPPRKGTFFLPRAFKNPIYLGLIGSIFLAMMGVFMPFFYLPTFGVAHGILNGASFFGRVIPGILGDRLGRLNMLFGAAICTGILILCMQALDSNASIIVFSGLYGFFSGAIVSGMTVAFATVPDNPREIGTYMGMAMAVCSIAALIGPPIDGAFVKKFAGFDQVAIFSGVVVLAGGVGILGVKTLGKGLWAKE